MIHHRPVAAYPFTQAALWQRCLDLFPSLDRDADRLLRFGVTPARVATYKADTNLFGLMDPDTVLVQEGAVGTGEKNADQQALVTSIQQVMACVGLRDDPRTAAYKRFGAADVANASEAALHLAGAVVVKQGRKYLAEYAEKGLTAGLLDEVAKLDESFVDDMAARHEAVSTRAGATRARILFANQLYRQLVAIANAGQAAWRLTDAQKAHEYVIDPAGAGAGPTPPTPPKP